MREWRVFPLTTPARGLRVAGTSESGDESD
jgi:hypothetical protein